MPEFSALLFCPICVSTIDVDEEGEQTFKCVSCGTTFSLEVRAKVIAEHSIVG